MKNSSFLKVQKFDDQIQTHVGAVRNWVELTEELTKQKKTDIGVVPQVNESLKK